MGVRVVCAARYWHDMDQESRAGKISRIEPYLGGAAGGWDGVWGGVGWGGGGQRAVCVHLSFLVAASKISIASLISS